MKVLTCMSAMASELITCWDETVALEMDWIATEDCETTVAAVRMAVKDWAERLVKENDCTLEADCKIAAACAAPAEWAWRTAWVWRFPTSLECMFETRLLLATIASARA